MLSILITGLIVGLVLWVIVTYVPMPEPFRTIFIAVIAIIFLVWALQGLGGTLRL